MNATLDLARERVGEWMPKTDLGRAIRRICDALPLDVPFAAEMRADLIEHASRMVVLESSLSLVVLRAQGIGSPTCQHEYVFEGRAARCAVCEERFVLEDHGVVGRKVITTAGVGFLVDAWQNSVEMENQKFHGIGTGSVAEAVGDTALGTELTTEYNPDNTRATGSLTEAAANIFRTVGTNTLDGTPGAALREHGILSQAATGGGVLWDRTVFGAITLSSGDGLQSTYDMTASSGG